MEEHFRTPEFPKSQGRPWPDFLEYLHGISLTLMASMTFFPTWTPTRLPDWALGNCKRRVFNVFDVAVFTW